MIYRLRFRGVDFGWEMLNAAGYLTQDYETDDEGNETPVGEPYLPKNGLCLNNGTRSDVIVLGYLYEGTGVFETDDGGNEVEVMDRLWGWHVDILSTTLPEMLEEFVMTPTNPRHVV